MLPYFLSTTRSLRPWPQCRRPPSCFQYRGLPRLAKNTGGPTPGPPKLPSFREQLFKDNPEFPSFKDNVKAPRLFHPIGFAATVSLGAFAVAAILTQNETVRRVDEIRETARSLMTPPSYNNQTLQRASHLHLAQRLRNGLSYLKEATANFPKTAAYAIQVGYAKTANFILEGNDGRRMALAIIAGNTAIWLLWQFPRLQPMMLAKFTHHPLSGKAFTMLTSSFSHKSIVHLFFNCMALSSFAAGASASLSRAESDHPLTMPEATSKWHFLALFISAGLFSSLVSHTVSTQIIYPRLLKTVTADAMKAATAATQPLLKEVGAAAAKATTSRPILPSLGSSGAIYAIVVLTALAMPDAQVRLIFPPTPSFSISTGVGAMVCLDILGVLRGWRLFDHYAHLGGAAFGLIYWMYGTDFWLFVRRGTWILESSFARSKPES